MPIYYADSSVLVKRHVLENGSRWVQDLFDRSSENAVVTSRVSMVEVLSAFYRRMRENDIDLADCLAIAEDFKGICLAEYELIELTPQIVEQSDALLKNHPLRAYDSIQLASALIASRSFAEADLPRPVFLTADDRLLMAARAEGLATDNPNLHP
jgi:uncharacterized protein